MNALGTGGGPAGVVLTGRAVDFTGSAPVGGEVGAAESIGDGGSDPLEGLAVANEEADGVLPANGGAVLASEAAAGGDKAGVVLAAASAEVRRDFTGVVAGTSSDADDVPPKTVDPVPLPNVASPPVFHAGTESGVFDAVWPNADDPAEANALNPPPPLVVGAPGFVSAGFEPLNVAGPPDANALNTPPLPNVEGDVALMGVTIGVVDMGVPSPVLLNPDRPAG